jgi:hypothetical protein
MYLPTCEDVRVFRIIIRVYHDFQNISFAINTYLDLGSQNAKFGIFREGDIFDPDYGL